MQYLVYYSGSAFYTNWFEPVNNYSIGMIVFDLSNHLFMNDGENWLPIEEDNL